MASRGDEAHEAVVQVMASRGGETGEAVARPERRPRWAQVAALALLALGLVALRTPELMRREPSMRMAGRTASGMWPRWEPADERDRHILYHPQRYARLPTAAEEARRQQRRLEESTIGYEGSGAEEVLTDESTEPISIHVDFSALYPPGENPDGLSAAGLSNAVPYTVCFRVGDWFRWGGTPPTAEPPCGLDPPLEVAEGERSHAGWVAGGRDPCGTGSPNTQLCDRNRDPVWYATQTNGCWGVCLEEDVLETADTPGCAGTAAAAADPTVCNMREYYKAQVTRVVAEFEPFLRVRRRTGPLVLRRDPITNVCARFAATENLMHVADDYCDAGIEADTIFFPTYTQYVPGVAGWGKEAGKDQFGRPLLILMGIRFSRE